MPEVQPPNDRLGVFKELSEVPDARRLYQYSRTYEGKDTWSEYRAKFDLSKRMSEEWDRFARRWKEHMTEQGRHHALARPDDVETWSEWLLSQFSVDRSYQHWNVIEGFYDWLKWHTDHPHAYNPFHMAARKDGSSAHKIWQRKMEKRHD
ncbi:MAG: hypothetical protein ABEJ05_07985 [Haloglomus sp.]